MATLLIFYLDEGIGSLSFVDIISRNLFLTLSWKTS